MKKLVIIRHAKSDNNDSSMDDFDRVLNERGLANASAVGEFLKEKNLIPDMIICSPAKRAIQTADIIAREVDYKKIICPNHYIYEAYVDTLQDIVSFIQDENDTVFLVGHNPGVSALAYMLCDLKESIPTGATVEIDFETNSWLDVSKENSTLISYDFPKK